MYCKHCGQQIDDNAKFCQHCGGTVSAQDPACAVPVGKKKKPLIVGIAIACVIFIVAFCVVAKQSADRKREEEALAASIAESESIAASIAEAEAIAESIAQEEAIAESIAQEEAIAESIAQAEQVKKEQARKEYIQTLKNFEELSSEGFSMSEEICNFVYMVWYDTVFEQYREETAAYAMVDGVFHDTFEEMIDALVQSKELYDLIVKLDSNKAEVFATFQMLSNPDDEFIQCYKAAEGMLDAYTALYTHWNIPSGDIYDYSDKYNEIRNQFVECDEKLILLIPKS